MNPYYQMPEDGRRRGKKGALVAVVVIMAALVILIGFLIIPSLIKNPEYPGEMGDGGFLGETEATSGGYESRPEETAEGTEASAIDTEETLPDSDRAISYLTQEEVEAWAPQVALCLERIQAQMAADEIVWVGLFDFEPDGRPEVVIGRQEANTSAGYPGRYILTIYDLDSGETVVLETGDEFPEIMHRSRAGKYPCVAAYSYDYGTREADGTVVRENYLIMVDGWPGTKIAYGMRRVGSKVRYTVDGAYATYEAYTAHIQSVKQGYTELRETAMGALRLTTAMDAKERAESLVTMGQAFVQP